MQYYRIRKKHHIRQTYNKDNYLWGKEYALIAKDFAEKSVLYHEGAMVESAFIKKESYLLSWFRRELSSVIQQYRNEKETAYPNVNRIPAKIWVYWWDGLDNAPPIVKGCVRSIKRNCKGYEYQFIDKENINDYLTIPSSLLLKHEKGIIGKAHFSDIVRMMLLAKYGGIWMDATLFCSREIPSEIMDKAFYSCKKEWTPLDPAHGRWSGWMVGGIPNYRFFRFMRDALEAYWENHDEPIEYLMMDYLFSIAYSEFPELKNEVDELEPQNIARDELMKKLNEPFDLTFFNQKTFVFKMSYRYGRPVETTNKKEPTFYYYIVNGK